MMAIQAMKKGRKVYSNFPLINLPRPELYVKYNDPLEVLGKTSDCLILMSEVGILLDTMTMYSLPKELWIEFRQHRKDGVDIVADAQSLSDVAYPFRKLIQFQYHIYSKYTIFGKSFLLARCFNPQPKGDDYGRRYWYINPYYFNHYDTNYKLEETLTLSQQYSLNAKHPYDEHLLDVYSQY